MFCSTEARTRTVDSPQNNFFGGGEGGRDMLHFRGGCSATGSGTRGTQLRARTSGQRFTDLPSAGECAMDVDSERLITDVLGMPALYSKVELSLMSLSVN